MGSKFRYGDGKVLGTQPHPTYELTSTHCVLHLNLIKDMFNIVRTYVLHMLGSYVTILYN